jgi:hypothetical protein
MHPFENESADLPKGVSPHLDVRLKPGWRFDRRTSALVAEAHDSVSLRSVLPAGAKVVPMVEPLAKSKSRNLSEDESLLARYVQVVLRSADDSADVAAALRGLDAVDTVSIPPQLGLP